MTGVVHTGGLPLEEYTNKTPPGWQPGVDAYPFKKFLQKLELWTVMCDYQIGDGRIGPVVAGRLKGDAYDIALKLRITTRHNEVLEEVKALAFQGEADIHVYVAGARQFAAA